MNGTISGGSRQPICHDLQKGETGQRTASYPMPWLRRALRQQRTPASLVLREIAQMGCTSQRLEATQERWTSKKHALATTKRTPAEGPNGSPGTGWAAKATP